MYLLRNIATGLRSLVRRNKVNRDLDEELNAYLEMAAVQKMKLGMSRKEALRAVRLEQGTLELTREVVRSSSWESVVENSWRDLRFAARMLRKAPGFTTVAVLTLALGIGANTAIFSLLNAVMLKTMPVSRPEQLVILRWSAHSRPENLGTSSYGDCLWVPGAIQSCSFSYPMYKAFLAHTDAFSSVLAMAGAGQLDLSGNGAASIIGGELVSGNYFEALGVSSALGRTIQPSDDRPGAPPVIVLSYGYWQRAFGGAAGVIDPRFARLTPGKSHDLWIPLSQAASLEPTWNRHSRVDNATDWWLAIIGRLK